MGAIKRSKSKSRSSRGGGSSLGSVISGASSLLSGKRGGGGGRRNRGKGPQYWANKVLVAKLKKKLYKIKYGGR